MDKNITPYKIIYHLSDVAVCIEEWKQCGFKIVFTNGCFDILHRGHVEYLFHAAALGDKLIVGLNSDSSVRRLKGDTRPIQDQTARAIILASLRVVDAVCIFEEDTPQRLIEIVSPDFLIKGGDYTIEDIVGYKHVTAYGGVVKTIPLVDGYSTSAIIKKF